MLKLKVSTDCRINSFNCECMIVVILMILSPIIGYSQDRYYIETSGKNQERVYYFKIMDSLVSASPHDSLYECLNCIRFMKKETKIPSSGRYTYFGQLEFTKQDLKRWHEWYDKTKKKAKKISPMFSALTLS